MTLTRMKFRVVDAAHDRAIQQALFAAGYSWFADRSPAYWSSEDAPGFNRALFTDNDGSITYADLDWFHQKDDCPEYLLHRGELVEAGNGTTPTFEEQQERLHRPVETEVQKPVVGVFDLETWPSDFTGIESRVLTWFNECSLPQPQHFVDVPEVENVGKRQHVLRSWSMFFQGILDGDRTSDIRWTGDRHFIVGDYLLLQEYDSAEQCYTGREQRVQITYIQQNKSNPCAISHLALADDYAVLSIKLV